MTEIKTLIQQSKRLQATPQGKVKVDPLRNEYNKAKWVFEEENIVLANDLTKKFLKTLRIKLKNDECIPITVLGERRMGKSTLVIWIMQYINTYLMEMKRFLQESTERRTYTHQNWKYQLMDTKEQPYAYQQEPGKIIKEIELFKYIAGEQTEFLRKVLNEEDIENCAICIDEYNRLASTGEGATIEAAYYSQFSDMFASRFIHPITASPSDIIDKNSMIILVIEGREKGTTSCKLFYRDIVTNKQKLLGSVHINISDILEQPYYKMYREKKHKRQDFLMKHHIRDVREPEGAEVILETYKKVQPYALLGAIERDFIKTYAEEAQRDILKVQTSILGVEKYVSGVVSIIAFDRMIQKLKTKLNSKRTPQNEAQKQVITKKIDELIKAKEEKLQRYYDLKEIWIQYNNIT